MRSGGSYILLVILTLAYAQQASASHAFDYQAADIRNLNVVVFAYHHDHGEYPVTDNQSTWYEKLTAGSNSIVRKETSDGRFLLDWYGSPLIFEPPSATNRNQIVIRAVGQNGIDDQGTLDDWDSRFGPNMGYWYKMNWPAAYRRAWICGMLALFGLVFIAVRIKEVKAKLFFAALWAGLLAGVVMPIGFDTAWGRHSASIDPRWIVPVSGVGALLIQLCILAFIIHSIRTILRRRHLRITGCIPCT